MKKLTQILSAVIISSIIVTSCNLSEPFSLPAWDTIIKIHLRQEEVTLKEIFDDSDVFIDSTSFPQPVFSMAINDTSEKQGLDESELGFKPEDDQIFEEIGSIELTPDPQTTPQIVFQDLYPGLNITPNVVLPIIPPSVLAPNPNTVGFESDFESVTIESADMFLIFHNNLIMDIDAGMVITLNDSSSGIEIGMFEFTQSIPRGESMQSDPALLENISLSATYSLSYSVPVAGIDTAHTVTAEDVNSNFTTEVHISNMIVTEAFASIPVQSVDRENASILDTGENRLIEAIVKNGSMQLSFNNNLAVSADLELEILTILDQNNNPLVLNTFIGANQETIETINLTGKKITNHNNPGSAYIDSIHYTFLATTISTGDSLVLIRSTDNIDVSITFPDTILVSSFNGFIQESIINIDPYEESGLLNLDDFEGTIRLPDFSVELDFHNEIGFDINFDISIIGEKNGESVEVRLDDQVIIGNSITTVLFNDTIRSPNIVDLMEILPSTIRVTAEGRIDGMEGIVNETDSIWIDINIGSLMKVHITDTLTYESSIDPLDIDSDTRQNLWESSEYVLLNVKPENGLPLRTQILFVLALDSADIFNEQISDSSEKIILNANILAGSLDANGIVVQPNKDNIPPLLLSNEQLQIFNKKDINGDYRPVFSAFKVFAGSGGQEVILGEKDALKMEGYIEVKYEVDPNEK